MVLFYTASPYFMRGRVADWLCMVCSWQWQSWCVSWYKCSDQANRRDPASSTLVGSENRWVSKMCEFGNGGHILSRCGADCPQAQCSHDQRKLALL
jgi:hypothetical protein